MIRTLAYSLYAGGAAHTDDNPRGIAPNWERTIDEAIADVRAGRSDRQVVNRIAGMLKSSLTKSWEFNDVDFVRHGTPIDRAISKLSVACNEDNVILAAYIGSNIDGVRADWGVPHHQRVIRRTLKRLREMGFTEVFVDTGGDMGGVYQIAQCAAQLDITLGVEWNRDGIRPFGVPIFIRNAKLPTSREKSIPESIYGSPVHVAFGMNGEPGKPGGVESPEEIKERTGDRTAWAWNPAARELARRMATATEVKV